MVERKVEARKVLTPAQGEELLYRLVHASAIYVFTCNADLAMEEIIDHLVKEAGKKHIELSREEARRFFLRIFLGLCFQQLEACYGLYADNNAFNDRLDAWTDTFIDIRRPLLLLSLFKKHMRESNKMPLICDIYGQLGHSDRCPKMIKGLVEEGTFTKGIGREFYYKFK